MRAHERRRPPRAPGLLWDKASRCCISDGRCLSKCALGVVTSGDQEQPGQLGAEQGSCPSSRTAWSCSSIVSGCALRVLQAALRRRAMGRRPGCPCLALPCPARHCERCVCVCTWRVAVAAVVFEPARASKHARIVDRHSTVAVSQSINQPLVCHARTAHGLTLRRTLLRALGLVAVLLEGGSMLVRAAFAMDHDWSDRPHWRLAQQRQCRGCCCKRCKCASQVLAVAGGI